MLLNFHFSLSSFSIISTFCGCSALTMQIYRPDKGPLNPLSKIRSNFAKLSNVAVPVAVSLASTMGPSIATGVEVNDKGLGNDAYTDIGGMNVCRLLNGMWQVSGAHGYEPNKESAVTQMTKCAGQGYTTFDLADIYGPAEDYVGAFKKGPISSTLSNDCQFFTKWVPRPEEITKSMVDIAIERSLRRMKTEQLGRN